MRADGLLFDKDGTLFDFGATWNVWAGGMIEQLAKGDDTLAQNIADAVEYDFQGRAFLPHSFVIAGTNREVAEAVASAMPGQSVDEIDDFLMRSSAEAPLVEAVPLGAFLDGMAARGLKLGVMTNDTEFGARAHLSAANVEDKFDFIAGFDSGHGAKPDPAPLLAFSTAMELTPARVVMVGDSTHDLIAGRAAGMQTVGVLTGPASEQDLAPHADMVLPNISHLGAWLTA
jgi:phosphoglycolate phosphatase